MTLPTFSKTDSMAARFSAVSIRVPLAVQSSSSLKKRIRNGLPEAYNVFLGDTLSHDALAFLGKGYFGKVGESCSVDSRQWTERGDE